MQSRHTGPGIRSLAATVVALVCAGGASLVGAAGYEEQAPPRASELLPPELLRGPHHKVDETVTTDGFRRVYTIHTETGRIEVRGEEKLRERVREIEALAELREVGESRDFGRASKEAGASPRLSGGSPAIVGSGWILGWQDPAPAKEGSEASGEVRIQRLGIEEAKREIANTLGIDPYTRDPALQAELNKHAWVLFAKGLKFRGSEAGEDDENAADSETTEGAKTAADVPIGSMQDAADKDLAGDRLADDSAEDLQRWNRLELAVMGVPEELREEFLENDSYSPKHRTVLVGALAELEGTEGRATFIEAAVAARSGEEADAFQNLAEVLRAENLRSGGLASIVQVGDRVGARTRDGSLLVPVLSDHAVWSPSVESFAEAISGAAGTDPEAAKARILFSGTVSERTRIELEALGLGVAEQGAGTTDADTPDEGAGQ